MSKTKATGKATGKATRTNVDMPTFVQCWQENPSVLAVSEKLGLALGSVQTRAAKYRGAPNFIPLKQMARGGAKKLDRSAAMELIASLTGQTTEQVKAASAALRAKSEARTAAKETPAS